MALKELVAIQVSFGSFIKCKCAQRQTLTFTFDIRYCAHEAREAVAFNWEAVGVNFRNGFKCASKDIILAFFSIDQSADQYNLDDVGLIAIAKLFVIWCSVTVITIAGIALDTLNDTDEMLPRLTALKHR